MKRVAVLGGGPAGAFAAERLVRGGLDAIVFDEKLAWEKPCGGGLTYKAYERYPFLISNNTPKRFVRETWLAAPGAGAACMKLRQPLVIYSRYDLNNLLLRRAERAGVRIEKARVLGVMRNGSSWRLITKQGTIDADYCVVATGARNRLPDMGTQLSARDAMHALGYYVPGEQEHIDIQFLPQLEGYIWVFPRCGHLSVGICGKGEPAQSLRARLERYAAERGISLEGARFYSHLLPSLEAASWRNNRVAGDGWLAVGDAAGLVDPITGEGLYYAMRSGELAGEAILADAPEHAAGAYRHSLQVDFADDLHYGAGIARRVFLGRFLFSTVPSRMVQFMKRSPRFYDVMQDLFAGTQPYLTLKRRLWRNLHGSLYEIVMNLFFERLLPRENQV